MFKRLRIALLLYLLLFVSAAQYFTSRRSTDWDTQLWVDVYTLAGDADPATRRYLDEIGEAEFAAVEQFLAKEAKRYGVALDAPFKIRVVGEHRDALPKLEPGAGPLDVLVWACACVGSPRAYIGRRKVRQATSSCSRSFTSPTAAVHWTGRQRFIKV